MQSASNSSGAFKATNGEIKAMNPKNIRLLEIQLEESEAVLRRILDVNEALNHYMMKKTEFDPEVLKYIAAITQCAHEYFMEFYFEDEH